MMFILLLQMISNLILFRLIWWGYKKFKLKITWHNLPVILICLLLIIAGTLLNLHNVAYYLPTGALLGLFIWTLNSIEVNDHPSQPFINKLLISTIVCMVWPQIIVFMIFYGLNSDKINLDEEL